MARPGHTAWLLLVATTALLSAAGATAQGCANATFPAGRSFERCNTLPVLGASLYWTYHAANGTAELAFRAPSGSGGWVAWGINPDSAGMAGSNVFVATQDGSGAVSVLTTVLESTAPSLTNGTLKFDVPVPPTAEHAAGRTRSTPRWRCRGTPRCRTRCGRPARSAVGPYCRTRRRGRMF